MTVAATYYPIALLRSLSMHMEIYTKDFENQTEKTETLDTGRNAPCRDVLDATDITIEEVSIDGICGVY